VRHGCAHAVHPGDFFEFWVGDEETDSPFAAEVAAALRRLADAGVPVYLMHGNRDFLLGRRFAAKAARRCCRTRR
jgi:UDP-2,3-diacylglucosamine hydrolase